MSFLKWLLGRPTDKAPDRSVLAKPQLGQAVRAEGRKRAMPLSDLEIAFKQQDSKALEVALGDAFNNGLLEVSAPVLIDLCRTRWHTCHEDVVSALQKVGDVSAVEAIEEAAYVDFAYLNYDDYFGLARKATWALADIGGISAKEALQRIATSPNSVKAAYANKKIGRLLREADRTIRLIPARSGRSRCDSILFLEAICNF